MRMIKHIDSVINNILNDIGRVYCDDVNYLYEINNITIVELDPSNPLLACNKSIRLGRNTVYIINNLDYISKKYILLHELGHILLEHDFIYNLNCPAHIYKSEREANYFAFKMMKFPLNSNEILSYGIDKILDYIQNHQGTFSEEDYYEASCDL